MVSMMHLGEEVVEKLQRMLRENKVNKQALLQVFGHNHTTMVGVPELINYNYKMKGVDLSNQLIANYCPLLQNCRY